MSPDSARSVKGAYPFRIGVSSRCGDDGAGLVPLFDRWRWRVDDFLLHLRDGSASPDASEVARLEALGEEALSSFTVQLPDELRLTDADAARRRRDAAAAVEAVRRLRPLDPRCYILRFEPPPEPGAEDAWRNAAAGSIEEIAARSEVPAGFFAVENGAYDFAIAAPVLARFGLSACTDVGSLYLHGHDIPGHLAANLFRSRTVHFHMGREGRLHLPASAIPVEHLVGFFSFLFQRHYQSVVTLEVLSEEDVEASLKALDRAWDRLRQER